MPTRDSVPETPIPTFTPLEQLKYNHDLRGQALQHLQEQHAAEGQLLDQMIAAANPTAITSAEPTTEAVAPSAEPKSALVLLSDAQAQGTAMEKPYQSPSARRRELDKLRDT